MVSDKFSSAQQIFQWGDFPTIINGPPDVKFYKLRSTTVCQQPNTDSVIGLQFMKVSGLFVPDFYPPCLKIGRYARGWRFGKVKGQALQRREQTRRLTGASQVSEKWHEGLMEVLEKCVHAME